MARHILTSLARIADLEEREFSVVPLERGRWEMGDYVVGCVMSRPRPERRVELPNGRMVEVLEGDRLVGAFGRRFATLEAVGDWKEIGEDGQMDLMTSAGLLGKVTSRSLLLGGPIHLQYEGHVMREGHKVRMGDFVLEAEDRDFATPSVLLVGTSMSAGKTTAARQVVHLLKEKGYKVVGAKLTGAGRYRDILAMHDAGADAIFDFVDMGLPSSILPEEDFRPLVRRLLSRVEEEEADVLVVEAGASPLEPYNGAVAIEELGDNVRCTVLCASDPYAVLGVTTAFGRKPDLVAGIATSTEAGIQLIEKLTGFAAYNFLDPDHLPAIREILLRTLETG